MTTARRPTRRPKGSRADRATTPRARVAGRGARGPGDATSDSHTGRAARSADGRGNDRKTGARGGPASANTTTVGERLQRYLARAGLGSRRQMEELIRAGRVRVDGNVATLGMSVLPSQRVSVDRERVHVKRVDAPRVLLYHKPVGVVSTARDEEGRRTCFDDLPKLRSGRWIQVGRLDIGSSGLMLFTTDGVLANLLAHPSQCIDREYLVRVRGEVDADMLKRLKEGVLLDDGPARFSDITQGGGTGSNRWYYVTVMEGRNREVRRLWESQQVQVSRLKRVRFGMLPLPSRLRQGECLELRAQDVAALGALVEHEVQMPQGRIKRDADGKTLLVSYPTLVERRRYCAELGLYEMPEHGDGRGRDQSWPENG